MDLFPVWLFSRGLQPWSVLVSESARKCQHHFDWSCDCHLTRDEMSQQDWAVGRGSVHARAAPIAHHLSPIVMVFDFANRTMVSAAVWDEASGLAQTSA